MSLRSQTLRIAAELPVGDPTRRRLLEAVSMDEAIWLYKDMAEDFARTFKVSLTDLRHSGNMVTAEFKSSGFTRMNAQTLSAWLKTSKVTMFTVDGKGLALHWSL